MALASAALTPTSRGSDRARRRRRRGQSRTELLEGLLEGLSVEVLLASSEHLESGLELLHLVITKLDGSLLTGNTTARLGGGRQRYRGEDAQEVESNKIWSIQHEFEKEKEAEKP